MDGNNTDEGNIDGVGEWVYQVLMVGRHLG
jgi:hypothetical protein